jgi:hypothetical protein
MKVAIHNGWLVFDNQLAHPDIYPFKCRHGRIRMDSISSYADATEFAGGASPEPCTLVWVSGQDDAWRINGDHQELLDGYFGGERVR